MTNTTTARDITETLFFKEMQANMLRMNYSYIDFKADIFRCLNGQNLTRKETTQKFIKVLWYYNLSQFDFYKLAMGEKAILNQF